ncbi:MAG: hypothetical protein M1826_003451 [Phylliscum demangeonii]|nr:MAG: hypothetical protein M1826_003451 [Phylliscum demangeonii]
MSKALQRCMKQKLAVILIHRNGNPKCSSTIPARYCVMDQTSDHAAVKQKLAVILTLGNGNPKGPSTIPARYCVMDQTSDHAAVQALQRCMKQKLAVVLTLGRCWLDAIATGTRSARPSSPSTMISQLHIGYFTGIALVEAWSAFFLLRIFAASHRNSEAVFHRTNIFRELSRSTEVRVACLGLIGITRAVTYSFQTTAQSATSDAGQLDRFITTLECMFPVVMMAGSKASLTRPTFGRSTSGARGLSSHTNLRSQHDVERHSFALLERPAVDKPLADAKVVENV